MWEEYNIRLKRLQGKFRRSGSKCYSGLLSIFNSAAAFQNSPGQTEEPPESKNMKFAFENQQMFFRFG
jgi:hypothetical protein